LEEFFMTVRNWQRRVGLTLIELVVVLVILAVLATLIVPRLGGLTDQANAATDATQINEVNRAALLLEVRNEGKFAPVGPNGADGLLTGAATGAFLASIHPNVQRGSDAVTGGTDPMLPSLYPLTLTANQLTSLNNAGITFLHYNVAGSGDARPSDSGTAFKFLAVGDQVAGLNIPLNSGTTPAWTGHGTTFPDRAFNLNPFNGGAHTKGAYVVFGLGQPCKLRGDAMLDAPIVYAAKPEVNYARILFVYRIPVAGTEVFKAQYVGAFSPDGTCINDNVSNFDKSSKGLSQ
jgi:prepilin-type N-terminal cleavage/methylation domain-containing protein